MKICSEALPYLPRLTFKILNVLKLLTKLENASNRVTRNTKKLSKKCLHQFLQSRKIRESQMALNIDYLDKLLHNHLMWYCATIMTTWGMLMLLYKVNKKQNRKIIIKYVLHYVKYS